MGQAPDTPVAAFCRKCHYALTGLPAQHQCPECGRPFDLSDSKTFLTRRPRRIWRRLRWIVYPLALVLLSCTATAGWLWWGWQREQPGVAWVKQHSGFVRTRDIGPPWLRRALGRSGYLADRADEAIKFTVEPGEEAEAPLWRLDRVRRVDVYHRGVTDAWVAILSQRLHPTQVELWSTSVTNIGLISLGRMRSLNILWILDAPITDEGLIHLSGLVELRGLTLSETQIRGPGLVHLTTLPRLDGLQLHNNPLDDSAVEHLARMSKLKFLNVRGTKITPAGLAKLRAALPECAIDPP